MCDCDSHIRLIYLMGFHRLTITAGFGSYLWLCLWTCCCGRPEFLSWRFQLIGGGWTGFNIFLAGIFLDTSYCTHWHQMNERNVTWISATCPTPTAHIVSTYTHRHTLSLSQYSVESSINGTNLSSREFLLGRLILGPLQTETGCSIVRPYVRVYSHLALNGAITLCFQTSEQW